MKTYRKEQAEGQYKMPENVNDHSKKLRKLLLDEYNKVIDTNTGLLKEEVSEFTDCPLCASRKFRNLWIKDGFTYVKCQNCKFVYLNPRLNEGATVEFYLGAWVDCYNRTKFFSSNDLDNKTNYRNLLEIARIMKSGKLLEIGCGTGYLLQTARDEFGFDVFGVEMNSETSQFCREERQLNVITGTLEEAGFPENSFDVVYMRHVFEHIREPQQLLQEIYKIMRKGGLIVIEVPNVDGLIYKLVGGRHVCVFGFEHFNFFSEKSLRYAFEKIGFETIQIRMESLDFTVPVLVNYFWGEPAFTTISAGPKNVTNVVGVRSVFSIVNKVIWPVNWVLPRLANALRKGSYITAYAIKS